MGCGAVNTKSEDQPTNSHLSLNRIYQRLDLIGSGTFGKVYLCINNLNGCHYALKVVDITAKTKEEAIKQVETLKGEIRVLRKLNHPNIVRYEYEFTSTFAHIQPASSSSSSWSTASRETFSPTRPNCPEKYSPSDRPPESSSRS